MSLPIAGATSLWIGWRYLRSVGPVSLITWVSISLGLGVAGDVVISVMNGFDAELHRRILGTVPHVTSCRCRGRCNRPARLSPVGDAFRFFS
jgi:ABC-type lipoprotein release transport system permease subunit